MEIQWSLVCFTALTGMAGWMFVMVAIDEFVGKAKGAALASSAAALIIAIIGGIASVTHLTHPENVFAAFNHPTSGIFIEAALLGLFVVFGVIYLILVTRKASEGARKLFAVLAAAVGVILSFAAGASYMMEARYNWDTLLLPLAYCGTAIPAGIAAYLFVAYSTKALEENAKLYNQLLLAGGVIAAATFLLYTVVEGVIGEQALMVIIGLVCSGVAPIAGGILLGKAERTQAMSTALIVALLALVGAVIFRCIMWLVSTVPADFFGMAF